MPHPNHYQTLQIDVKASPQEIKRAFRRLARQYHPDLNPNDAEAAEIFRRLRAAYDVLSDPIQRRYYDLGQDPALAVPPSPSSAAEPSPAHHHYLQGIGRELARDYGGALEAYEQAIALDPTLTLAYLHRCQMHYALAQDRAVLEDCTQLIQHQAHLAEAHYYQGLARFRLGYTQSAIEAFSASLNQDPDQGQALHHRAMAQLELGERELAIADLHQAISLFQAQGNGNQAQASADLLAQLQGKQPNGFTPSKSSQSWQSRSPRSPSYRWLPQLVSALPGLLLNPSANLLPLYGKLSSGQAATVGLLWLALTYGLGLTGAVARWSADSQRVILPVAVVVTLAMASFLASIGLMRLVQGRIQGLDRLLFVGGAAALPLGLLCLVMVGRSPDLLPLQVSLAAIAGALSLFILHSGLIQVCDVPESQATLAAPLIFLLSGWLAYWTFHSLMPPPLELLESPNLT